MRRVQVLVFAKFMSDSVWYFWLPKYLYDVAALKKEGTRLEMTKSRNTVPIDIRRLCASRIAFEIKS